MLGVPDAGDGRDPVTTRVGFGAGDLVLLRTIESLRWAGLVPMLLVVWLRRETLDRGYVAKAGGGAPDAMPTEQQDEILLQAVAAARTTPDPRLDAKLEALRDSDPSPKVREAAGTALASRRAAR